MSKAGRKPKPSVSPAYLQVVNAQASGAETLTEKSGAAKETAPLERFECPDWFTESDRRIFDFLQDHLRQAKLLEVVDQIQLQILARNIAMWQALQERINVILAEKGTLSYVVRGRNGQQHKTMPELAQAREYERAIGQFGSNFGLSPADRERLKFLGLAGRGGAGDQGDLYD